jgi:lipopolysaccharide assembly outer membrane protein LptD (OstA)
MSKSCRVYLITLLCSFFVCLASPLRSADVQISADQMEHTTDSRIAKAKGNVEITYLDVTLTCDEAMLDQNTMDCTASGNVIVTMKDQGSWKAPSLKINLKSKDFSFGPYRLDTEVWHLGGEGGNGADNIHQLHDSWLSTCDCPEPHYSLKAKSVKYNQSERTFTAKHVTLRVADFPIFYLPVLWGSTDNTAGTIFRPGYSGRRGAYLRLGRIWTHGPAGSSQLYVDAMSKRGFGIGQETTFATDKREIRTQLYGIHDNAPSETADGWDRRFKTTEDRYRLHLYMREQFTDGLSLRVNLDALSDISMLEDWFRSDYRHWRETKSFATLAYDNSWMNAELTLMPRINTFSTLAEKLPELKLTIPHLALGETGLVYRSENSAGFYSMKWRNNERDRRELIPVGEYINGLHGDPQDYSAFRADTLQILTMPLDMEYLTLTPRAAFRVTGYSRSSRAKISQEQIADNLDADNPDRTANTAPVRNYDRLGGSIVRFAGELGMEARTRIYSGWQDFTMPLSDANGIRHIIEPYVNYTFAPDPSEDRDNIYFFDEVDRLEKQHFVRLGLDQFWQTREENGEHRTLLSLETYMDTHMDKDEVSGEYMADLGIRLGFAPRKDLRTWAATLQDIGDGNIMRGEVGIRYGQEESWQFSLKYIYRNGHLSRSAYSMASDISDFFGESGYIKKHFEDSDTLNASLNIPINERTSFEVEAEYDFEENRLAEHYYYLTRQLHCWTMVTGCGWDYGDFEFIIMLRLTAFPKVKIDMNI